MHIKILGAAAGGGFPQWNCYCNNCSSVRANKTTIKALSQSSIAINLDNGLWALINASPDIRHQLSYLDVSNHTKKIRINPLAGIILLDSQLDHTTGLLSLREGEKLNIYATESVMHDLSHEFPVLTLLTNYCEVNKHFIYPQTEFKFPENQNISFIPIRVDGKAPPYSRFRNHPSEDSNIGLLIKDNKTNKKVFYSPGLSQVTSELLEMMGDVNCVLVDGTFWVEDEMQKSGAGKKQAKDMGHLPLSGDNGLLFYLKQLIKPIKYLIHINNTNPILNPNSPEYKILHENQIQLATDGMDIIL